MLTKKTQQIDFSSVLFDTLFGLVLFFSVDSFLEINDPLNFIFYLFSIVIIIHWWLIFKSTDDMFEKEVTDSGLDVVIGIIELIIIEYIVLTSRSFDYIQAGWFLAALFSIDLIWTIIWRYVGKWKTTDLEKIKSMENELNNNLKILVSGLAAFLILLFFAHLLLPINFVCGFIVLYLAYIILTFKYKIIDINIF